MSKEDGSSLFLWSDWIKPAILKIDSDGTDVAGIEKIIFASFESLGKISWWSLKKNFLRFIILRGFLL